MKAIQRVWRDGAGRLVPETDPGATFLVYAVGDDIPDEAVPPWLLPDPVGDDEAKGTEPAPNKARKAPANKTKD